MTVLWTTDKLVALDCPICADFRKEEKPENPEKNHRSTERDTLRELSHMKCYTLDLVSVVSGTTR